MTSSSHIYRDEDIPAVYHTRMRPGRRNILKVQEHAERELGVLSTLCPIMSLLDPEENIFVYRHNVCHHPPTDPNTIGIMYTDYGNNIYGIRWTPSLLIAFTNVIKGITLMNSRYMFHNDIHPKNIVLHDGVFRIIDFGEATDLIHATPQQVSALANKIRFNLRFYRGLDEVPKDPMKYIIKYRMFTDIIHIYELWSTGESNAMNNAEPEAQPFLDEIVDNKESFKLDADRYYDYWIATCNKYFKGEKRTYQ